MNRTVILAAGDYPAKGSEGERLLFAADCVIACDGAAETYFKRTGKKADVVVGDLDSLSSTETAERVVREAEQETNDLCKAIRFAIGEGLSSASSLVILGATGKREDHTIGNVYRAMEAGVRIVTDAGEFVPVFGSVHVKTWKNSGVSVFASDHATKMSSRGLKWSLEGVEFTNPAVATLNRASNEWVTIKSDRRAMAFFARNERAVRALVALGSNMGDRAGYLHQALRALKRLPDTRFIEASSIIETKGVEVPEEFAHCDFYNQVALFETTLPPLGFSRRMHAIEDWLGRVRTVKNGPRTIDLDLIAYGDERMQSDELTLPHPRAKERDFVVRPMRELGLEL